MNWNHLALPWQACVEEAWTAYCSGSYPIGAVITDAQGRLLARGRNRNFEEPVKERYHRMDDNLKVASDTTTSHPTPYTDVNTVLHDLSTRIQALLGNHFCGMYLYGSLALGDFDPHHSDIDFIVVTNGELTDPLFNALQNLHASFDKSGSPWAAKIEAAYIPRDVLYHTASTSARYPQVEKGTPLFKAPLEIGWIFQCHSMREHGVVVAGPDPRTLLPPIDPADLRRAIPAIPNMWLNDVHHNPTWLDWVRQRENQAFVVLTLCRLLYTLDRADVTSKPAAARWAQKTLDTRWIALIERALREQHSHSQIPEHEVNDTVAMIQYTLEKSQL